METSKNISNGNGSRSSPRTESQQDNRLGKDNSRFIFLVILFLITIGTIRRDIGLNELYNAQLNTNSIMTNCNNNTNKLKIAIISGFVTRDTGPDAPRINTNLLDHMVNKACYADLWGYDYIFNTTWGFDWDVGNKYWLEYGTWHRVPHIQAALPNYDWIIYADTDWVIQDMTIPIESFIRDWELHGKKNVSIFVPVDANGWHVFSAYAVMIRNSPFGNRMVENWLKFANGLCKNGNFQTIPGKYDWKDSDQPGIWYSLAKTHSEFYGNNFDAICMEDTGTINTSRVMGPEMREYFLSHNVKWGNQGKDLYNIPDDQPIIWSKLDEETKSGLGLQKTYGDYKNTDWPHAFALHTKIALNEKMKNDIRTCRTVRKCNAYYDNNGIFHIGCNNNETRLAAT